MHRPKLTTDFDTLSDHALLRLQFLIAWRVIPFSTSTLWRKCRIGEFPAPVRVSNQITAWRVGDIRGWLKDPGSFTTNTAGQKRQSGKVGAA
jgi:prophage regulatory protein